MISVLYVDDERDLLDLAKIFLEQSPDLHVDIEPSAVSAMRLPGIGQYDVIISDYQMPDMDGIGFLKAIRSSYGAIPFILFTGRGREEIVIEAINNGADFYLQKGGETRAQFAELVHKIRQADARKKAESRLIESEKRLSDIIDFLPDATFAIDKNGIIIAWNRAIEEMTGISAEQMMGRGRYEYALPFYGERCPILIDMITMSDGEIAVRYSNITREGSAITAETNLPHPMGKRITVLAKASPLYNQQGEITGAIEAIRDITERKRAEDELHAAYEQITASEEELRKQLDILSDTEKQIRENAGRLGFMLGFYERVSASDKELMDYAVEGAGIVTGSPLGYLAFLNDDESEMTMYAWSRSAMTECSIRDKPIVYKTARTGLWGEAVRQKKPVITNTYAAPNPAKKGYPPGHPEIIRHMNIPVIDAGHVVIVAGVANKGDDYSDEDVRQLTLLMQGLWQVLKQRRTKEALHTSEEKYRDLFENSVVGIFRTTLEGRFSALNTTFARIAGYSSAQEMMDAITDIRHQLYADPRDRDRFIHGLRTDGYVRNFQAPFNHRDGHIIWGLINANTVRDTEENPRYYEGTFEDITEQKNAEEALRASEEKYRTIIENIQDVYYRCDPEGNLLMVSPSALHLLGYESIDELVSRNLARDLFADPGQLPAFRNAMQRNGGVKNFRTVLRRKDGSLLTISANGNYFYGREGQVAGFEGTLRDLTTLLEASEEAHVLASLIDISPVSVVVHDEEGNFIYANQRTFDLHGYSRDEFMKLRVHDLDVPVTEAEFPDRVAALKRSGELSFDVEHFRKDKTKVPLHVTAKITRWNDREVILSVSTDLTERVKAEKLIFENEERLQLALAGADLGTWNWNIRTGEVVFNERWAAMLGYTPEEIDPDITGWQLLVHPDDLPRVKEVLQAHLDGKAEAYEAEHRLRHKDGSWVWVLDRGRVIERDEAGFPLMAAGTHLDITQKKHAEDALKQSERRYRSVIENIQDGFFRANQDGRIIMASPSAAKMFGYTNAGDILGHKIAHFYHDPGVQKAIQDKMNKDTTIADMTIELKRRDGTTFWGSVNAHFLYGDDGKTAGIEGSIHDVTEHMVMEKAIREANRKLTLLNSITRHDVTNQLTALQGYIQIASMVRTDPVVQEYLAKIARVADTITRQVEFTRTYQELAAKDPAWFRIESLVSSEEAGVPVRFSGTCSGVEIFADPMIGRVFHNLFDNAVRHGGKVSEITVRCEREPDGMIVIVEDDGVGIASHEKEKIFERGYGRHTGLGLFLAQEILAITGIRIRETGIPGNGARFEILVPGQAARPGH